MEQEHTKDQSSCFHFAPWSSWSSELHWDCVQPDVSKVWSSFCPRKLMKMWFGGFFCGYCPKVMMPNACWKCRRQRRKCRSFQSVLCPFLETSTYLVLLLITMAQPFPLYRCLGQCHSGKVFEGEKGGSEKPSQIKIRTWSHLCTNIKIMIYKLPKKELMM